MLQGFSLFITDLGPLRGIWKHLGPTLSLLPGIVKLYSDERSDLRSSGWFEDGSLMGIVWVGRQHPSEPCCKQIVLQYLLIVPLVSDFIFSRRILSISLSYHVVYPVPPSLHPPFSLGWSFKIPFPNHPMFLFFRIFKALLLQLMALAGAIAAVSSPVGPRIWGCSDRQAA